MGYMGFHGRWQVFFSRKAFPGKWALTLFCSAQQRAPTHQTEEYRHRSCTQWRETLGRALNFLDTHTLQLSCHRSSGQLWEKTEQFRRQQTTDWSVSDCVLSPPNAQLRALNTCPSENNQKKYELHHSRLPGHHWIFTNLVSGVCFLLIVFFFQGHSNMCYISPEQFNVQWTAGGRRVFSLVLPNKTSPAPWPKKFVL